MLSHCCFSLELFQLYFILSIFFSTFCSDSFSIVEFSKFSLRYVRIFKYRMLTWTETGQEGYLRTIIFVKYWPWASPAAGLSLKLLQQTRLGSLLFSAWFVYCKAAAKYWSYWNNKPTISMGQTFKLISDTDLLCCKSCTNASAQDLRIVHWNINFHGGQRSDCVPSWVQHNVQMWLNLEIWQWCCPKLRGTCAKPRLQMHLTRELIMGG